MSEKNPVVTIGIPVYNGEKYLSETLESLQAQTFGDFEIIISDNASTDGTETISRSFAAGDERIQYQRNSTNVGFAANCSRLPPLARGRYFKWAAADDILHPEFLQRCVRALDEDPGAVLASTRFTWIDEFGRPIGVDEENGAFNTRDRKVSPAHSHKDFTSSRPHLRFRAVVLDIVTDNHTGSFYGLIRASALAQTYLVEKYLGAEKVLLARLALQGKILEVEGKLLIRRDHAGNFGRRNLLQTEQLMNPESRGLVLPRSRLVAGYLRAINDAPAGVSKSLCRLAVVEKFLRFTAARSWAMLEPR